MLRNRIFVKICLWFWITTIIVFESVMFVERLTETDPRTYGKRRMMERSLPFYGQTAMDIYEREGAPGLTQYFVRLERATGIRGILYADGRPVMADFGGLANFQEMAIRAEKEGKIEFASLQGSEWAISPLGGRGGKHFTIAAEMPHGPPGGGPPPFSLPRTFMHLVVSGMVCYWLARHLTKPIVKLRETTRKIAAGDLSARVGASLERRRDEISDLAGDFDLMAGRIEGLLNAQRNLLRDISHELRSPLARMNVALELCRRKLGPEAEQSLARIERESEKLEQLIGQLLTLHVAGSGSSGAERSITDIETLIREVAGDASFEAEGLGRSVALEVQTGEYSMLGNKELLRRAVENIVRNAVRYTGDGTAVEISLRAEREKAIITVRDHGDGVPEDALDHLFKPFYRVAEDRNRQTGGVGLGLAISEAAVRFHNGDIRARNAPGGGLMVEMVLPLHLSQV